MLYMFAFSTDINEFERDESLTCREGFWHPVQVSLWCQIRRREEGIITKKKMRENSW